MKLAFPEKVLTQHLIALGKTGAGKSSTIRHIVEHLLRHKKRVCIVDIKGDWWGLKSSADGKSAGFPVVAFGDFREPKAQDVPINAQSGKQVAELITSGNRPCIIGFRGWMPGAVTDFWIDFASTLFNKNEGELYVVISECHNYAPKGKVLDPKAGKVLHWTNRLLSEGRGLGMTFLLDSQRPQKVHNDTLTSCETLIAMRVTHAADRQAIKDWIDGCGDKATGNEVLNTLAQMATGEGWVWSPEIGFGPERIKFPFFETFDSFAPAQLQKKVSDSGWSSVDLEAVKEKLATVIEEAKGNDPKELKNQIEKLRNELSAAKRNLEYAPPDPVAVKDAIDAAIAQQRDADNNILREIVHDDQRLRDGLMAIAKVCNDLIHIGCPAPVGGLQPVKLSRAEVPTAYLGFPITNGSPAQTTRVAIRRIDNPPAITGGKGGDDLSGPQRQILTRLAEFVACGRSSVRLSWLAASMGTTVRARGFEENMRTLVKAGYVAKQSGDYVKATSAGESVSGRQPPLGGEELHNRITQMLSGPQSDMLRFLLKHSNPIDEGYLATHFNTTVRARGFEENIRFLRSNDLITTPSGQVQVADWLL